MKDCIKVSENGSHCNACGLQFSEGEYSINLNHIKQNGLALDSPLLWAIVDSDIDYLAVNEDGYWIGSFDGKLFVNSHHSIHFPHWTANNLITIGKINICYTGDWKESLTKRPDGM